MSVKPTEMRFYGSANMSDGDGTTQGGAVNFAIGISFADISPNGMVDYVSSSASDTAVTLATTGRDATGVIQTETKTLTGTTPVTGSQTFARLLKAVAGGTTAVGDIAVISHVRPAELSLDPGTEVNTISDAYTLAYREAFRAFVTEARAAQTSNTT